MKRMLPPSRIEPIQDGNLLERCLNVHLVSSINYTPGTKSSFTMQAIGYAAVICLLLGALGIFGDAH
jgi:hypothetical protein